MLLFGSCCLRVTLDDLNVNLNQVSNVAVAVACFSILFCLFFPVLHSEDVLPSIHADKYYPCELVGTWNTWYGEQDQAGRITNIYAVYAGMFSCSIPSYCK